jgi:hypothetical protein
VIQAAFLFTVVGTTGFLGVLAGQLPGVTLIISLFLCMYAQKFLYHLKQYNGRECILMFYYHAIFNIAASFDPLMWKEMYFCIFSFHRKMKACNSHFISA